MNLLTVDFETYYDKEYSLSKLTTEEYLRDSRYETIGVSVKVDDEDPEWFSGTEKQIKKFLNKFKWSSGITVAHNARFDMAILNWKFDIRPKRIADTLSMARALHGTEVGGSLKALATHFKIGVKGEEVVNALGKKRLDFTKEELNRYANYCVNDTNLTHRLFHILFLHSPLNELKLIDLTTRMFTEPVLILARPKLHAYFVALKKRKEILLRDTKADRDDLMSNGKFAEALKNFNVVPPTKISARTGKETWAFAKSDKEFMALTEHSDPAVQALMAARLGLKSTIEETRTQRFIDIAGRGNLPIPLRYYAAHTGRWGGDDKINLQNLPQRENNTLKTCILAPKDHIVIDADSSQIEARTLAWLADQTDLVDAFERGEDVYKIMASSIYEKPVDEIDTTERFVGKSTILGAGYGMGADRFKEQLRNFGVDFSLEECARIIEVYRRQYPRIPKLWKQANDKVLPAIIGNRSVRFGHGGVLRVEGEEGILLPNGMHIKYPNLRWIELEPGDKPQYVYDKKLGRATVNSRIYGGKVIENVCQALARIIIGEQMLFIAKKYKVAMTVHDSITSVVHREKEVRAKELISMAMCMRPEWALDLPLNCEVKSGTTYGDCK
jgi:DNA polymerase I-like protein with 3'-5' exonuclease and polymerase domains